MGDHSVVLRNGLRFWNAVPCIILTRSPSSTASFVGLSFTECAMYIWMSSPKSTHLSGLLFSELLGCPLHHTAFD